MTATEPTTPVEQHAIDAFLTRNKVADLSDAAWERIRAGHKIMDVLDDAYLVSQARTLAILAESTFRASGSRNATDDGRS